MGGVGFMSAVCSGQYGTQFLQESSTPVSLARLWLALLTWGEKTQGCEVPLKMWASGKKLPSSYTWPQSWGSRSSQYQTEEQVRDCLKRSCSEFSETTEAIWTLKQQAAPWGFQRPRVAVSRSRLAIKLQWLFHIKKEIKKFPWSIFSVISGRVINRVIFFSLFFKEDSLSKQAITRRSCSQISPLDLNSDRKPLGELQNLRADSQSGASAPGPWQAVQTGSGVPVQGGTQDGMAQRRERHNRLERDRRWFVRSGSTKFLLVGYSVISQRRT